MTARGLTWFEGDDRAMWLVPSAFDDDTAAEAVRTSALGFGITLAALLRHSGWPSWADLEIDDRARAVSD